MIYPAGISGEASTGDKIFHVQTEFAPRPKPRITTSISVNGEVVQKVENIWERLPQSEEDKDEIERFLKKQHQEVIKDIKEKGERFTLSKEEKQRQQAISKIKEVISGIQGVSGWVLFSDEDQIISPDVSDADSQRMVDLARNNRELASFLSSVSKVGNLVGGLLESKDRRMVFLPIKEDFFAAKINPEVDVKQLVQKIRSTAQTNSLVVVA